MRSINLQKMLKMQNRIILFFLIILSSCETIRDNYYERYGPPYIRSQNRAEKLAEKLKRKHNCVFQFQDTYGNKKYVWFQKGDTVYMHEVFPWITKRKKILTQKKINIDSLNTIPEVFILDGIDFYYEYSNSSTNEKHAINLKVIKTDTSQTIVALREYLIDLKIISPKKTIR